MFKILKINKYQIEFAQMKQKNDALSIILNFFVL